jgi:PAS domain S-box-containing protein
MKEKRVVGAAREQAELFEERFLELVQSVDAIVWEAETLAGEELNPSRPRRYTFVSRRAEELLGFPVKSWISDPEFWPKLIHHDDRDRVIATCLEATREGRDCRLEYRAMAHDGRVIWLCDHMRVVKESDGRIRRHGVMVDITGRRRIEETLRTIADGVSVATGEAFFRSLVQRLTEALEMDYAFVGRLVGGDGKRVATLAVSAWGGIAENFEYELSQTPCENVVGKTLCCYQRDVRRLFPDDPLLAAMEVDSYMGMPLFDSVGGPLGLLVVMHGKPLGNRDAAETILRVFGARAAAELERIGADEERARLTSAVEQTADWVMITGADGKIVYVNPAFEKITGYSAAEALGQTPRILKSGKQDRSFYEKMWRTILAGETWRGELVNRRKDGSLFTVEHCITPVKDSLGKITHFASVSQDITARKELEAQLRQAQKMEAVGRLAGGVAHDFNNLLTVISGRAHILLDRLGRDDSLRRDADLIGKTAERAAALTRQLLAFSRQQVLQPKALDVNAVVAGAVSMLERLIGEDIHIVTAPGQGLWHVLADPVQIEQVILNLAVNARDAMPDGGRLTIETANVEVDEAQAARHPEASPGPHVLLSVRDTGLGMDAETLSHIFEPFFTTKEPGKGTGLGLATVYGIVKQSGGHISVESEVGRGTAFRIYLRRAGGAGAGAGSEEAREEAAGGSETILLVEDDDAVRELAREILESRGYKVLEARHGREAIQVAERHQGRIDLLVTDVVMPRMRGTDLAGELLSRRPEVKVLYMSGYTGDRIGPGDLAGEASGFLQKPFTPDALSRKVRELLGGPGTGSGR